LFFSRLGREDGGGKKEIRSVANEATVVFWTKPSAIHYNFGLADFQREVPKNAHRPQHVIPDRWCPKIEVFYG
jgi:hypothetical protein